MGKKLGFGCMRLPLTDPEDHKSIDIEQTEKMFDIFLERGFTYFDTAYMYHDYMSEPTVKKALVDRHPRDSYTITSKLPVGMLKCEEDVERIFNEQMTKLGIDYFDYYLLHNLNRNTIGNADSFHCWDFIKKMKEEGKIRHLGFSFHDMPDMLDDLLTKHPEIEYVQIQLNYLDWEAENVKSRANYETIVRHGRKCIVMEPVKGGTLAQVPAEAEKLLKSEEPEASVPSWAIRFAASQPAVFMVLSGMSNIEQVLDNTGYMQNFQPLKENDIETISKVVDIIHSSISINCTACRYCVEGCPKHIPIPEYFSMYNGYRQAGGGWTAPQVAQYGKLSSEDGTGKASDCIKCGKCEKSCPQHLTIRKYMEDVAKAFED